jgi:hypothetical protein
MAFLVTNPINMIRPNKENKLNFKKASFELNTDKSIAVKIIYF